MKIKPILILLGVIAIAAATSLFPQAVTNTNVDIVLSQQMDDALHVSYRVDDNLRTNGILPYTSVQLAISYKQFLSQTFSNGIPDLGIVTAQNEAALIAQIRSIRESDPARYARIFRVAFNKGNQ